MCTLPATNGRRIGWLLLFLVGLLATAPAQAQVPRLINYQGSLVENDFPASGSFAMTFGLYSSNEGGEALWQEEREEVPVTDGRFSVLLGQETSFPEDLFAQNSNLFLQVAVGDETLPRLRLTSTAFALRAAFAENLTPGAVGTNALADEAVTGAKIASGTIGAGRLADGSVESAKIQANAVTSAKINDGAVQTADLGDGVVTNDKLSNGAVTSNKLGDSAVSTRTLVNGAVTRQKIQSGELVTSLNDLTDGVELVAGDNINIQRDQSEGTLTISSSGGGFFGSGQPSSIRWKENVEPLSDALATVERLRGVRFEWKEDGREDIGFIAEEVGEVLPEVVSYEDDGTTARAVDYPRLVALLVEALKEQQEQLEERETTVEDLSERVERLERLVRAQSQSASGAASQEENGFN